MKENQIEQIIREGEGDLVEFKLAPPRPSELAERLCGFANGTGGMVILGVRDQTWELVGLGNPADTIDILLRAARLCKPVVQFLPALPEVVTLQGKKLVIATIPINNGLLHQAGGAFWIRRGTNTIPLGVEEIQAHLHNSGLLSWGKKAASHATLQDLDLDIVRSYLERRATKTKLTGSQPEIAELLIRLDCAVQQGTTIRPTNAGLILFGQTPRQFLAQAEIVCGVFSTDRGRSSFTDRRELTGTLPEQIEQAEAFLKLYNPIASQIEGFHRIDRPAYPLDALREAVVNAVVHRDYSLEGQAVRIFIYPGEKIDIYSPGGLVPGLSLNELKQGRLISRPRNPLLVNLLRDFPGNYMERMGLGINFMINKMRELGRPDPEFWEVSGDFCVTFLHQEATEKVNKEKILEAQETHYSQAERQEMALRYVQAQGGITNGEYCKITRVGERTALRDLEEMVSRGALRATGSKRGRRYIL